MSRIGNQKIQIPEGTKVEISGNLVKATGPKGELEFVLPQGITAAVNDNTVIVKRASDSKPHRSLHGTSNRVINNLVIGVTEGFKKKLEFKGVGYQVNVQENKVVMRLGFSHQVELTIPEGITVAVNKNIITVEGIKKDKVGQFASEIREQKKPEVYKGKGIRYQGEFVKKKAGKTAASAA